MIEVKTEAVAETASELKTNDPIKKMRTPAQLETLRLAREKAATVRAQNAELRRKQVEIDKAAAAEVKRQKVEQLEKQYSFNLLAKLPVISLTYQTTKCPKRKRHQRKESLSWKR